MTDNIPTQFSLRGRVAIITGSEGLLGREYRKILNAAGAKVLGFDLKDGADHTVDITDKSAVSSAVEEILKKHGRVDVLINNAAINPVPGSAESAAQFAPYEDYSAEAWRKEIEVGLTGALFMTQAVAAAMKKAGSGSIINISSTYGNVGPDNRIYESGKYKSVAYATVKGAMLNFTRAWATYLAGTGIRVNTLTLGGVEAGQDAEFVKKYSERTVLGRMARPDEYNGAMAFLASDASSYMTGSNLIIDGGWTAW